MAEAPFVIQLAGYVLDFHQRNRCRRCGPDGWCPRVAMARAQLTVWRQRKQRAR
ncbi:hypothetical protein [Micromonospora echinofusca]|uniref:Uncharacterized protein n=1 Tax=Micromonospora echinofusca TaxID=47858 RepID=A0ABS3VRW4_MICEH|nr:hypothetical protein [Micromonospora echinofusca]MBO4207124.1 hypothetical protein [Micromonospora echinofusca]